MKPMKLDKPSFHLGMINCFAEMVAVGVKRLAISPPLDPEEYRAIRDAMATIVEGFGIRDHLETSLLVTALQSPAFTRGKWSVLYYKEPGTLEAYLALKKRREALERQGAYDDDAHREISRDFMNLLSYPATVIEEKIRGGRESDPFLLSDPRDP
jgi:hypothetical protein